MSLWDLFEQSTQRYAARIFCEMRPRYRTLRWTYSDLRQQTLALGEELARREVQPGDRVLIFSENSPWWAAAFFAVISRGAVAVPLNHGSPAEQLDRLVAACRPKLLLKSKRLVWPARPLPTLELGGLSPLATSRIAQAHDAVSRATLNDNLAEIVYTSGTTGEPKGVMLTHENLMTNLESLAEAVPVKSASHVLTIVPLFHMYGQMTSLFLPLRVGATVTYLPSLSSRALKETLKRSPITHLVAVPEFLKVIMDRIEEQLRGPRALLKPLVRRQFSKTLETIACGGAPLDTELETKWWRLGFKVLQGYGLTETSPVVTTNSFDQHRFGSVGKPVSGVELKLAPDGEILVRGKNVMAGYYCDEARTTATFEGEWFKTDDLGRLDPEGFLYVFGRKKYMILGPGGANVFPEDLETELNRVSGVKDSAVLGLPREGRVVIHAVLLCENCDGDQVIAKANQRLAPHEQIQTWSRWPEVDFPRSATRKVKKEEVLKALEALKDKTKAPVTGPSGAASPLQRLLASILKRAPAEISAASRLVSDLALDSLTRLELVSRLEEELGVSVTETAIRPTTTVAELEALLKKAPPPPKPTHYPRWPLSRAAGIVRLGLQNLLVYSWLAFFVKLKVTGDKTWQKLPGPVIFMPNHKSYLDPALITWALPKKFRTRVGIAAASDVLYQTYRSVAWLSDLVFNSYPFPREAEKNIQAGLEYTGRLLDDGWSVMVFPEGAVNRTAQTLLPLKGGAGVLGVEMSVPIIPVAIIGPEKIAPPNRVFPRHRGSVEVRFGAPIVLPAGTSYQAATRIIEEALRQLLNGSTSDIA